MHCSEKSPNIFSRNHFSGSGVARRDELETASCCPLGERQRGGFSRNERLIMCIVLVWTAPDGIKRARMRSLLISSKGDRPWNRLAELAWIRRNTFSSFTE